MVLRLLHGAFKGTTRPLAICPCQHCIFLRLRPRILRNFLAQRSCPSNFHFPLNGSGAILLSGIRTVLMHRNWNWRLRSLGYVFSFSLRLSKSSPSGHWPHWQSALGGNFGTWRCDFYRLLLIVIDYHWLWLIVIDFYQLLLLTIVMLFD